MGDSGETLLSVVRSCKTSVVPLNGALDMSKSLHSSIGCLLKDE